jgi:hypothetical protein
MMTRLDEHQVLLAQRISAWDEIFHRKFVAKMFHVKHFRLSFAFIRSLKWSVDSSLARCPAISSAIPYRAVFGSMRSSIWIDRRWRNLMGAVR